MAELIDARDVLDANAKTARAFRGKVLGRFKRTGPNRWDPYTCIAEPGEVREILPGLRVHLEEYGARFRLRSRGRVLRIEWVPDEPVPEAERRQRFAESCLEGFQNPPGRGMSAFIQKTLKR